MRAELSELWRFRGLLWQLVRRDLKVRYKNSRLGFLWSIAPPLMQVAVITFAMKRATAFAAGFPNYSAYVLAAMIPWTYFQTAVLDSSQSLLVMYGVIKKVYLPREIIPLASAVSNFIHFLLSLAVFFTYLWVVVGAPVLPTVIWLPYLVVVQFMLVTAVCLVVSCLNVFYEDVKYIISILMNLALFVLPIIYVLEQMVGPGRLLNGMRYRLFMLNPLTSLITGFRKVLLEPPPASFTHRAPLPLDVSNLALQGGICFVLLLLSYAYFNSRKWQLVERP